MTLFLINNKDYFKNFKKKNSIAAVVAELLIEEIYRFNIFNIFFFLKIFKIRYQI